MSGIFGVFNRNHKPVSPAGLESMRLAMSNWGREGLHTWHHGSIGLGQGRTFNTPESQFERLPVFDDLHNFAFTAAARVDNRAELARDLSLQGDLSKIPDGEFIRLAYVKWGELCTTRIFGDWAFAAWHPKEHKLFLARDHFGNTALYYYLNNDILAFASERRALLALNPVPLEMDELYLAQVLVSWSGYHDGRTIYRSIRRLRPAHTITVTPEKSQENQYWRLEDTPLLRLPRREDYIEPFRELFDKAVVARLRTYGNAGIATTLSGGLDSGSVTATAAEYLRSKNLSLTSFTSIPLTDTGNYVTGNRFGDEYPYAQATAGFAGNVDLIRITAQNITPIQAIRRVLQIHDEPAHAAGNLFWLYDLEQSASARGFRTLLTGQKGNSGISWTGDIFSQSPLFQLRKMGLRNFTREHLKRLLLSDFAHLQMWNKHRRIKQEPRHFASNSAINGSFAQRLHLAELHVESSLQTKRTPLEQRWSVLKPGNSIVGFSYAQMGAAHGIEIRDPTADVHVLEFSLSVPDHVFMDPHTGIDRWLIRESMKGRLPDEVRLNQKRGRQAGDVVPRLRASAAEVESTLKEIEQGSAREFLDTVRLRAVWDLVKTQDSNLAFNKATTILLRGVMAGLWVNGFYK